MAPKVQDTKAKGKRMQKRNRNTSTKTEVTHFFVSIYEIVLTDYSGVMVGNQVFFQKYEKKDNLFIF